MSVVVCQGTETPAANGCTAQADLVPISVQVSGEVFSPMSPTDFCVEAIVVYGLLAVLAVAGDIVNYFKVKL